MDEKNQTPNITFGNTGAETLRLGVRGLNIVRVAGFEYFVHLLYQAIFPTMHPYNIYMCMLARIIYGCFNLHHTR